MSTLFFKEKGNGYPVILLHGFPLHQELWHSFAEKLSETCRVITLDIPGFGQSPLLEKSFTIDDIGKKILCWIEEQNITNAVLIGHSLGGYVALSIASQRPEIISGIVLFHSTAYADTEEKKQSRNKVLEFIARNGVVAFTSNFIVPLFFNEHHPAIPEVRAIAAEASVESVRGFTEAMRDRNEKTGLLRTFPRPILFLAGENDGGISVESIRKQAAICLAPETYILSNVAHMGMFENEKQSLEIIRSFIRKIFSY